MKNKQFIKADFSFEESIGGIILGIDEVGKGSVAGPVVAAGVILNNNIDTSEINDSKKLSVSKREEIFNYLKIHCYYVVKSSSVEEIEKINILQASLLAMRRVIADINYRYDYIFVDGNVSPDQSKKNIKNIIGGDQKSLSIAAASIVAKVTRDKIMDNLDLKYPQYLWKQNKGYCTKQHINAIQKYGITCYHRKNFLSNLNYG